MQLLMITTQYTKNINIKELIKYFLIKKKF